MAAGLRFVVATPAVGGREILKRLQPKRSRPSLLADARSMQSRSTAQLQHSILKPRLYSQELRQSQNKLNHFHTKAAVQDVAQALGGEDASSALPTNETPSPLQALNIPEWLSRNKHLLQPPIGNHCVYESGMTVMLVGGPNERSDFHVNHTPELFYQYQGSMLLRTVAPTDTPKAEASESAEFAESSASDPPPTTPDPDSAEAGSAVQDQSGPRNKIVDTVIHQGSLFLLPAGVPHCPIRFRNTVGVVVELPRPANGPPDALRWYCTNLECGELLYEEKFHLHSMKQIKQVVEAFQARSPEERTCPRCSHVVGKRALRVRIPPLRPETLRKRAPRQAYEHARKRGNVRITVRNQEQKETKSSE